MTPFDWFLVLALNGGVIAVGIYLSRGKQTSGQWFLGGRVLPWWGIGMSMFATNVDNADLVGITGNTYKEGLHIVSVYALGSALGGILAAYLIVPKIYRLGLYTNAEYLEARFGPTTRVLSAVIQLQYRSSMLGLMIWSVYLLMTELVQLTPTLAWALIISALIFTGYYSAWGGLKAVVWTDALQGLIMIAGGAVIFTAVWQAVGGWAAMNRTLVEAGTINDVRLADLPHAGRYWGDHGRTSPYIVALAWTIVGCGYWTVNHTQTMRLMGARSLWDMRMATVFGIAISMPVMIGCACLGIFARALPEFRDINSVDTIYPRLADRYLGWGFKGLVVAGILSAAASTFDSMGSSLSAIFTRDIYARLFVRDRDDRHYVLVSRWATVGILMSGFLYLPLILKYDNMLRAFTTLIPVFVSPLFTIYLMGATTRVPRCSGLIGLMAGSAYGFLALIDRDFFDIAWMPLWFSSRWLAFVYSVMITAATMLIVRAVAGREAQPTWNDFRDTGWLHRSRESLPAIREHPFTSHVPIWLNAQLWAAVLLAVSAWIVFGLLW